MVIWSNSLAIISILQFKLFFLQSKNLSGLKAETGIEGGRRDRPRAMVDRRLRMKYRVCEVGQK
jgi:hypothetical protein